MNDAAGVPVRPLEGVRVLDFAQFLAGPSCATRLGDLGAEVIKIERPDGGDACRRLAVADQWVGDDSLLFHTINRGKMSVAVDLKQPDDFSNAVHLIESADVLIHNFRPGVMERIGLCYDACRAMNPGLIYGTVTGYGDDGGPWRDLPGQDLVVQARSGMAWLSGDADDPPVPIGISVTDMAAGAHLAQGVLAALFRRARTGKGALVEVSLLGSAMDMQFEQFTSYLNDSGEVPRRSAVSGANVHAAAPYGIYATADGYLAVAMTPISRLAELLPDAGLSEFSDPGIAFERRDEIKTVMRDYLAQGTTERWIATLEPAGIWCAPVMNYRELVATGALEALNAVQTVGKIQTTTCPIRIDSQTLTNRKPAPALGADTASLLPAKTPKLQEQAQ